MVSIKIHTQIRFSNEEIYQGFRRSKLLWKGRDINQKTFLDNWQTLSILKKRFLTLQILAIFFTNFCHYKRPLDSYACPEQHKSINISCGKKYSKIVQFYGEKQNECSQFLIFSPKGSFSSSSLNPYCNTSWLKVHPIFWSRCPTFRWGTFVQIWMVGLGVNFGQPKGVKLGIFC